MTVINPQAGSPIDATGTVTLRDETGGIAFVPASTPLIGLNYYDGRFLRADDLNLERRSHRAHVEFSNRAGGGGVVSGFDVALRPGGALGLSDGLAIAPRGAVLYLPESVEAPVADLVAAAKRRATATPAGPATSPAPFRPTGPIRPIGPARAAGVAERAETAAAEGFTPCETALTVPTAPVVSGVELYLIAIGHVEGLCGNAEVFGRLCDDACVTATDRPYLVDGVALLLVPLVLRRPLPASAAVTLGPLHLRSRVASAFFADEAEAAGSRLSAAGLAAPLWCGGAPAVPGDLVPLGLLGWSGTAVAFLDAWTARRERMEAPSRAYWQGRMEARPWPVFLAQVLQFQCQLAELGAGSQASDGEGAAPSRGRLLDGGIVELPAAGYLPVDPGAAASIRQQLQDQLGPGVDLRVCAVRRDQIAHELERAQHMNRISLLRGVDNPAGREEIDILVPDGLVEAAAPPRSGLGLAVDLAVGGPADGPSPVGGPALAAEAAPDPRRLLLQGAARIDADADAGITARFVCVGAGQDGVRALARFVDAVPGAGRAFTDSVADLRGMRFGTETPSSARLRRIATEVLNRAVAHRAERADRPFVTLASAPDAQVAAVSFSWWVARNPFVLADGASTVFSLAFDTFVPSPRPVASRRQVDGRLRRREGRTGPLGGPEVVLEVQGVITAPAGGIGRAAGSAEPLSATLVLTSGEQGGRQVLALHDEAGTWLAYTAWQGSPMTVQGVLVTFDPRQAIGGAADPSRSALAALVGFRGPFPVPVPVARQVAELFAVEDATIGNAGNEHHDAAVNALLILAGMNPGDATYVDRGVRELFPPTAAPTAEIRATTDWALFRRRRREDCGGVAVVPPPASRVAVWMVTADSPELAQEYTAMLRGGTGARVPWRSADMVEFTPDTASLRTPPGVWRQHYQVAGGGELIRFAGYAVSPDGTSLAVGVSRAQALVATLAPIANPDPQAATDLVTDPPPGELVPGTEGSVFLVTYNQPVTPVEVDCVEVLAVDAGQNSEELVNAITQGDPAVADTTDPRVESFGSITFTGGDPDEAEGAVLVRRFKGRLAEFERARDPRTASGVGWVNAGWAQAGNDPASKEHLSRLASGLDVPLLKVFTVDYERGERCPTRLYLLFLPPIR
jgi:hypothetical protein